MILFDRLPSFRKSSRIRFVLRLASRSNFRLLVSPSGAGLLGIPPFPHDTMRCAHRSIVNLRKGERSRQGICVPGELPKSPPRLSRVHLVPERELVKSIPCRAPHGKHPEATLSAQCASRRGRALWLPTNLASEGVTGLRAYSIATFCPST